MVSKTYSSLHNASILYQCKFGNNPPTGSWDILHTITRHDNATADANTNVNGIPPKPMCPLLFGVWGEYGIFDVCGDDGIFGVLGDVGVFGVCWDEGIIPIPGYTFA